jgi:endonuclease-3
VPTTPARRSPRSARSSSTGRRRPSRKLLAERASGVCELLAETYPGSAAELCALKHRNAFQLLCATILSAQCTDERVNMVTPALFGTYPGPRQLAAGDREELEEIIRSTGFFRSKASHLIGMAQGLVERFGPKPSDFPTSMEDLTSLPGVGRKTANVVRSVALGLPGLPVDTHVLRVSKLLGLTANTDPVKVETDLCTLVPEEEWGALSLRLILHGRKVCIARRPRCTECILAEMCPSAQLGGTVEPVPQAVAVTSKMTNRRNPPIAVTPRLRAR